MIKGSRMILIFSLFMDFMVSHAYLVLPRPRHSWPMSLERVPELQIMKYSTLVKENRNKRMIPSFPSSSSSMVMPFFPWDEIMEKKDMDCIGLDVGCGCGHSTLKRVKDYPGMPWIGVDKMLDRFDREESHLSFFSFKEKETKVMFWHEDFLDLPRQTSFQQMIQEKHVYLSFTNVLHEFWQDEKRRDDWFLMLNEIQTYASSCTLLFEDYYAEYPPSMISFFLESNRFPHTITHTITPTMTQELDKSVNPLSSFVCHLSKK